MAENNDSGAMREALVRAIIRAGAEGSTLDEEDCEVLRRYGVHEISHSDMVSFFTAKAARIERQMKNPH